MPLLTVRQLQEKAKVNVNTPVGKDDLQADGDQAIEHLRTLGKLIFTNSEARKVRRFPSASGFLKSKHTLPPSSSRTLASLAATSPLTPLPRPRTSRAPRTTSSTRSTNPPHRTRFVSSASNWLFY